MKKNLYILVFLYLSYIPQALCWNSVGHRLIAQIAYDQLTRNAKTTFNRCNRDADHNYMSKNFVNSSVWLDTIRARTHAYDAMHFIDIPFSTDGTHLPSIPTVNAVWAIDKAIKTLSNPKSKPSENRLALRILVHVVGDIHQPLHATTKVSRDYPEGDRGGNLVKLHKNHIAKNLHSYWDKGAGLFVGKRRYGQNWIKQKAISIEQRWPCNQKQIDLNPMHWAQESNALAKQKAYAYSPDITYQHEVQKIIEKRIALAGCRLASTLMAIETVGC